MVVATITADYGAWAEQGGALLKNQALTNFRVGAGLGDNSRAVLRFPITSIPVNANITKVELKIYSTLATSANPDFQVRRYNGNNTNNPESDSAGQIYTTFANPGQTLLVSSTAPRAVGLYTLVLGAISSSQACLDVEARVLGGTFFYSIAMTSDYETPGDNTNRFVIQGPTNATNRPQLIVTYDAPPNTPGISEPDSGENFFNSRPTIESFYSHPDGTAADRIEVEIYPDSATDAVPGSAVYSSGSTVISASNNTYVYHRPASGTFTAGVYYRARVRFRAIGGLLSNWSPLANGRMRRTIAPTAKNLVPTGSVGVPITQPLSWDYESTVLESLSDSMIEIRKNSDDSIVSGYPKWTALACDDFDRANGAPGTTPAANGSGHAWTTLAGTVQINSNALECTAAPALAHLGTLQANVRIIARVNVSSDSTVSAGIAFLISDASNYWRFVAKGDNTYLLEKVVAGTPSTVASGPLIGYNGINPILMEIKCANGSITWRLDHLSNTISDSFNSTATKHGVYYSATTGAPGVQDIGILRGDGSDSGRTHTTVGLTDAVEYKWRAKVRDGHQFGAVSSYSIFTPATAPTVTITAPTSGQVLSAPTPQITWSYSSGSAQTKYRVVVRAADNVTIIYDSGYISGTATSHFVPTGYLLNSQAYVVTVYAQNTANLEGTSPAVAVTTSWTLPGTPATLVVVTTSGISASLTWTITTPDENFYSFNLYATDVYGAPQLIKRITDVNRRTWDWWFPPLNLNQTYTVRQAIRLGEEEVESADKSAAAMCISQMAYINSVYTPLNGDYQIQLGYNPQRALGHEREFKDVQYWGRDLPTRHFGTAARKQIQYRATMLANPQGYSDNTPGVPNSEVTWNEGVERMVNSNILVCLRDTRGRKFFGYLSSYAVAEKSVGTSELTFTFQSVDFDEASIVE